MRLSRSGRIRIPEFQRPFRWGKSDVVRLFDSIYRGYPVGNLLMWQRPAPAASVRIGPLNVDAPEVPDALWVIDGQQRITSLVGALAAPPETVDPQFRIYFDLESREFVAASRKDRVHDRWLPMPVALRNQDVLRWQRERPGLSEEDLEACDAVVTAIRDYEIPMYIVEGDDEQALREIFDRLNNFGKQLRREEVFEALHAVKPGMEPSGLRSLSLDVRGFGFGKFPDSVLMQAVLAIRGSQVDRDFRNEFHSDDDRHKAFLETRRALGNTVEFMRDECNIPHQRLVPYSLFIPVLARYCALFGEPEGRPAQLLRRWVWRGSVIGPAPEGNTVALRRYAGAVYGDALESATRLLQLLPRTHGSWSVDVSEVRLGTAKGKVNVLALLQERPRIVADGVADKVGQRVDIHSILDSGANPLAEIFPENITVPTEGGDSMSELEGSRLRFSLVKSVRPRDLPGGRSIAARIIHPARPASRIMNALKSGLEEEILSSQCMDFECVEALRKDKVEDFIARRSKIVTDVIRRNVQRNALFGFSDGPEPAALFDDEGEAVDGE